MKTISIFLALIFQSLHLLAHALPVNWPEVNKLDATHLEQKVGQLLMVFFQGEEVNEEAKRFINELQVGGIILYQWANGLTSPLQVKRLCEGLQQHAKFQGLPPLLIAVDQEGGLVQRLKQGFTQFPGNAALGRANDTALAYQTAAAMGKELSQVGINFNLAPVIDVNNNLKNPVISVRSYGSNSQCVTKLAAAAIEGYLQEGVMPCLKHFPGHGDTTTDSHKALPVVNKSYEELLDVELFPYLQLAQKAPAIMTAHILFPLIDHKNCATLSADFMQRILRKEIGFNGVAITDSLAMRGVLEGQESIEETAVSALIAGNDILLLGGRSLQNICEDETPFSKIQKIQKAIVKAVRAGRISAERIDEAYTRVMNLKASIPGQACSSTADINESVDVNKIAKETAMRSVIVEKWPKNFRFSQKKALVIAPEILAPQVNLTDIPAIGRKSKCVFFESFEPSKKFQEQIKNEALDYDLVIFLSYNSWKYGGQKQLLNELCCLLPTACIATRDRLDLDQCPEAFIKISTVSPSCVSIQVAAEWLNDNLAFFSLPDQSAEEIGLKIWSNECRNQTDQLTFWRENEQFPSMGIGHFMWPPKNYEGEGQFHKFVQFAITQKADVPDWLIDQKYSPWRNRNEFYRGFHAGKMQELRRFLLNTRVLQVKYMVTKLNETLKKIILEAPLEQRQPIINNAFAIANMPKGLYALIDYLHFKREGISPTERYRDLEWGLMQMLSETNFLSLLGQSCEF